MFRLLFCSGRLALQLRCSACATQHNESSLRFQTLLFGWLSNAGHWEDYRRSVEPPFGWRCRLSASAAPPMPATHRNCSRGTEVKRVPRMPEGNGPFPAIVALHNCDGLAGCCTDRMASPRDWAEPGLSRQAASRCSLTVLVCVVWAPSAFRASGCSAPGATACRCRCRAGPAAAAEPRGGRPYRPHRLGQWGVAVLWTIRPRAAKKDEYSLISARRSRLYPGRRRLRDTAWSARMPTLILVGAKDDWASASACQQMVAGARGRTAVPMIQIYPKTPTTTSTTRIRPLQQCNNVAVNGTRPRGSTLGPIRWRARMP